jgi:divalent metal cation (Fe/Co/Zn/Cd) transporter
MALSSSDGRSSAASGRGVLVARAKRLEYLTIGWNGLEAAVALIAGLVAGSVALVGFGLDSVIETASAVAVLWRLGVDHAAERREKAERRTQKIVGVLFLMLAVYIAAESFHALWMRERAAASLPGLLLAVVSVIVMPVLARVKRRVAAELGSRAMESDSRQADFCAYLSAILLAGLLLQRWFCWWWTDAAAALTMVPIIAHEGVKAMRGGSCDDCGVHAPDGSGNP